jgi:hypothetical protein
MGVMESSIELPDGEMRAGVAICGDLCSSARACYS